MIPQLYVLSKNGIPGEAFGRLASEDSSLIAYRGKTGEISFFSDEDGLEVLGCLLGDSCVITARGLLIRYGDVQPGAFLGAIASRADFCFHRPDNIFFNEVENLLKYDQAQQKMALYQKHGRQLELPPRPILYDIGTQGQKNETAVEWALTNCKAISVWRRITGADRQAILFGDDRQLKVDELISLCSVRNIEFIVIDNAADLPNW